MKKRVFLSASVLALAAVASSAVLAQDNTFKIGLILPMTGQQASTGRQIEAAAKLYMAQHGNTVAGKKVELIVKDDTSVPDVTKRLAQELVVNDKVNVLAGFGITPSAMATAPVATQSKTPMVVMAAATSSITLASPYVVRTSFTLPQASVAMADWAAAKGGIKKVVTLVSDYGPGIDAEKFFKDRFIFNGGSVVESLRVPMRNPDFAPFLQKVRDAKPDALFVFVPSGAGAAVMKQFLERGMDKAGIKLVATERFARTDTSVTPQALKLTSANPDAILVVASGSGAAMPQKGLVERNYKGKIYQTHAAATPDLVRIGGKDVEGGYVSSGPAVVAEQLPDNHPSKKLAVDFVTHYEKAMGPGSRNQFAAHSYDAAIVLEKIVPMALKKGKPGTPEFRAALRDAMENMGRTVFSHGVMHWSAKDHWGYTNETGVLLQVKDGKFVVVQ